MSNPEFKLCRDFMTTRCRDRACRWAHDPSYCKLAWVGHCPYGDRCRNRHTFPAANRKDRKKAVAAARQKEEAKCQALMEMEKKGLLPPGTAAAALAASIRFRRADSSSECSTDTEENGTTIAATSRRGRSTGSRSSRSRSRPRSGGAALSSAKIAEVAASANATAAVFGPNTAEGRRARSAIAVIRSLPQVGRVLERIRDASGSRPPSRPTSRAPSARSRDSGAVGAVVHSARPRPFREPTLILTAAQEPQLQMALDVAADRMTFTPGPRVVSIHPNIFSKPGDEAIYERLSTEINAVIAAQQAAAAEGGEGGATAEKGAWRKQCPTFRAVVDRVKLYFGLKEIKSTRLNLFSDESESRAFQSERLKGEKAVNTNFMISLSFGGPRQHGLMDPQTGRITSLPLSNGIVYGFGKELMEQWFHGVMEVPEDKRVSGRGRVSLVLWASKMDAQKSKKTGPSQQHKADVGERQAATAEAAHAAAP